MCPGIVALLAAVCAARGQTNTNVMSVAFSNSTPISIPQFSDADPYPSVIQVPVAGTVQKVTVTLYGLSHPSPSDIQGIMLVGPTNGPAVELMSGAGDQEPITNVNLNFDDGAASHLPVQGQIVSGTYQTSVYVPSDFYDPPAPAPNTNVLAGFIGTSVEGTWSLYIVDFSVGASGTMNGGWGLTITYTPGTAPPALVLTSPIVLPNGQVQLTLTGPPGTPFSIEDSSDLQNWTVLATNSLPASGSYTYTTASAAGGDLFYRAVGEALPLPPPPPPPQTLILSLVLGNGQIQLTVTGPPGTNFSVEDSSDLQNWTVIATNTLPASGSFTFTSAAASGDLFYRALVGLLPLQPVTSAQGPTLSAPTVLPNGHFQFTLTGKAGTSYWIEASANLQTWTIIATNLASNGVLNFTDPSPVAGSRYYQAVVAH
jgi:hypothetical protein